MCSTSFPKQSLAQFKPIRVFYLYQEIAKAIASVKYLWNFEQNLFCLHCHFSLDRSSESRGAHSMNIMVGGGGGGGAGAPKSRLLLYLASKQKLDPSIHQLGTGV